MRKFNAFCFDHPALRAMTVSAIVVALAGCAQTAQKPTPPVVPAKPPARVSPSVKAGADMQPVSSMDEARAAAPELSLRKSAPLQYVVKRGDTLWAIAGHFLTDPWQWPQLWYENPQVHNPHLIFPGERLTMVWVHGHPRLTATEVLHPQVQVEPLDQAAPTIPLDAIRNFLNAPRLIDREDYDKAPAVAAFTDARLMAGAHEQFYATGLPRNAGSTWSVIQLGRPYRDPKTDQLLGYEAIPAGEAVLEKAGNPAQMMLTRTSREVLIGDRLIEPEGEQYHANFYPHAPAKPIDGQIISVFGGLSEIGQYQIVALDRGARNGLTPGTVLSIVQGGRTVPDPRGDGSVKLPDLPVGLLMVFKVTPRLSYALIMQETRPAHVMDRVVPPVHALY